MVIPETDSRCGRPVSSRPHTFPSFPPLPSLRLQCSKTAVILPHTRHAGNHPKHMLPCPHSIATCTWHEAIRSSKSQAFSFWPCGLICRQPCTLHAHTARRRHGNGIPAVPAPAGGRTHLPTSRLVFSQSGLVGFSSSTQQNALRLVTRAFNTISPISPLALRDTYLKVIRL